MLDVFYEDEEPKVTPNDGGDLDFVGQADEVGDQSAAGVGNDVTEISETGSDAGEIGDPVARYADTAGGDIPDEVELDVVGGPIPEALYVSFEFDDDEEGHPEPDGDENSVDTDNDGDGIANADAPIESAPVDEESANADVPVEAAPIEDAGEPVADERYDGEAPAAPVDPNAPAAPVDPNAPAAPVDPNAPAAPAPAAAPAVTVTPAQTPEAAPAPAATGTYRRW